MNLMQIGNELEKANIHCTWNSIYTMNLQKQIHTEIANASKTKTKTGTYGACKGKYKNRHK